MSVPVFATPADQLVRLGLHLTDSILYQLSPHQLVQHALRRKEGVLNDTGALVIRTGAFTGRSPKDRFIVKDELTTPTIHWNDFNLPIDEISFNRIFTAITTWFNRLPQVYVRDSYVCADPRYRLNLRVISETASASLFAYNMF
ncbi:MAG TPA: phosphoenolpyruvate carboxykinase (ATP), partial [Puia sp.]|nr:phosphoenolpyruvate carboxykinase (ATP) [Puia sp.]